MEKNKKKQKEEKITFAKEGLKAINDIETELQVENIIKDNKIEFSIKNKNYRVRIPTNKEQEKISKFRRKTYINFIEDDSYLFRKQWIEKYKKKGINIEEMDNQIAKIQANVKALLLDLAKTSESKAIKILKDEILKLRDKQYRLSVEKTDLLFHSIEDQLTIKVNSYTLFTILEKKEEDNWIKCFEDYEKFENSDDIELTSKGMYYLNYLIYNPDIGEKDESKEV